MAASGKLQEAEKHIAEARKCLKTGLLKWSPDYHNAASHFEKAAVCYRTSREFDKAITAYKQSYQAYYDNNAIYHAGKMLEQAAHVAREIKRFTEAADLMNRASECYHESGHPDTAGQVLNKTATMLQHENPPLAAKYFQMTSEFFLLDEKPREAANALKNALRMYCRARDMPKVVEVSRLVRDTFINAGMVNMAHEAICVEVLALLLQDNRMQSLEVLDEAQSVQDFATSEEYTVLTELVNAITENDEDSKHKCCDSGVFKAMDPEFAKLVRELKTGVKAAVVKPVKRQPTTGAAATTGGATKAPVRNPSQLSDMRSQLLGTSKDKATKKKTRVDTSPSSSPSVPVKSIDSPPQSHSDPPAVSSDPPEASRDPLEESHDPPEESHDPSEEPGDLPPGSHDHLQESHEDPPKGDSSDEDEPLDIN